MRRIVLLLGLLLLLPACGDEGGDNEVWIYTSLYPEVIERIEPALQEAIPEVRVRWYQKGSEQVAARLNIELEAGKTPCDLLMTSDPFYYAQLKAAGHLLPYECPAASAVSADLRDADHAFATVRVPLMVIAVNHSRLEKAAHPRSFGDLTKSAFAGRVAMGDPLKSGTTFTTVAALAHGDGWGYFEALRTNDVVSAGGNSTVLHKVETGERPVGIILLENLLPSLQKGAPITVVYPEDGAVPVPSPLAILASTDVPDLARRVYDFMFSDAAQDAIVAGSMYSPLPGRAAPAGARPWSELKLKPWTPAFVDWVVAERDAIKTRFREIMRR